VLPWKQTSPGEEQRRFIEGWLEGGDSFLQLCNRFGISPKTGYKRVERFRRHGWDGLGDRSRAPHTHPNRLAPELAEVIVQAKRAHPTWGPRKLLPWLAGKHPDLALPAPSTAGEVLRRAGLVQRRRRVRQAAPWSQPFAAATAPNDVWAIDFKGWFRTGDGRRCDPLTIEDCASRYLLACSRLEKPRGPQVRQVLERTFRDYGLPRAIRSDNGPPFASMGLGGLSQLSVWRIKLGIMPERIAPGHPEQNGRLERLHLTLKQETAAPPKPTPRAQQQAFARFREEYNEERPHEALGQCTPASQYYPSERSYPSRLRSPQYPSSMEVRQVRTNGEIMWRGRKMYLSEALVGEPVGLRQADDRFWTVHFGPMRIGMLDSYQQRVVRVPVEVLPMCPV
jgi:putative transposase